MFFDIFKYFQPQKKKREPKKGKRADAGEKDDEDVMLNLKKLSVEASDEEDEPGRTPPDEAAIKTWSFTNIEVVSLFLQSSPRTKEAKRFVSCPQAHHTSCCPPDLTR